MAAPIQCAVCERMAIVQCVQCKRYFCGTHSRVLPVPRPTAAKRGRMRAYCYSCKPESTAAD